MRFAIERHDDGVERKIGVLNARIRCRSLFRSRTYQRESRAKQYSHPQHERHRGDGGPGGIAMPDKKRRTNCKQQQTERNALSWSDDLSGRQRRCRSRERENGIFGKPRFKAALNLGKECFLRDFYRSHRSVTRAKPGDIFRGRIRDRHDQSTVLPADRQEQSLQIKREIGINRRAGIAFVPIKLGFIHRAAGRYFSVARLRKAHVFCSIEGHPAPA